jgi:uncharacterized protein (TIGR00369 family)
MPSVGEFNFPLSWKTTNCYVCGPENAQGLRVPFVSEGEGGCRAEYTARAEHCGWPGLLHGGIAFTLMDEALAYALYFHGLYGVTARVETRFRQPIPAGTKLIIRAWTLDRRRRLVDARAEIRVDAHDGALVAEAEATMYLQEMEADKIGGTGAASAEIGPVSDGGKDFC